MLLKMFVPPTKMRADTNSIQMAGGMMSGNLLGTGIRRGEGSRGWKERGVSRLSKYLHIDTLCAKLPFGHKQQS